MSCRSEQNIEKVPHVRHACNNSHVLMYPMLCILTVLYDKIHKSHKGADYRTQSCKMTFDLSTAVNVTTTLFLCRFLNCIRADLFINNALYKCCIIKNIKI